MHHLNAPKLLLFAVIRHSEPLWAASCGEQQWDTWGHPACKPAGGDMAQGGLSGPLAALPTPGGAAGTWCWQQRQQIAVKYIVVIDRCIFSDLVDDVE